MYSFKQTWGKAVKEVWKRLQFVEVKCGAKVNGGAMALGHPLGGGGL